MVRANRKIDGLDIAIVHPKCSKCGIQLDNANSTPSGRNGSQGYTCKLCRRARNKLYRLTYPEREKAHIRKYRMTHAAEIKQRSRQYRIEHAEEIRRKKHDYYLKHIEKIHLYNRLHPEQKKNWFRRRRVATTGGRRITGNKRPWTNICELCSRPTKRTVYHHWDDNDLLRGTWVCNTCHQFIEKFEKGYGTIWIELKQKIDGAGGQ